MAKQQKNMATGFLRMSAFNMVAALILLGTYFPYSSSGGSGAFYFLIAGGVLLVSAVVLYVLYGVFKSKIDKLGL